MIVHDVVRTTAVLLAIGVLAAGCGGRRELRVEPASAQWVANARGVVDQLHGDVVDVAGYDRRAAARRGLTDDSALYELLVAYTDFGGCRHMVAAVGVQPRGRADVVRLLNRACVRLLRAEGLFTRAVARSEPRLLVAATRWAVRALPVLDEARLELSRTVRVQG